MSEYKKLSDIHPEDGGKWIKVLAKAMRVYKRTSEKGPVQSAFLRDGSDEIFYRAWRVGVLLEQGKSYSIDGCMVKVEHDNRTIIEANSKTIIREIGDIRVPTIPIKYENVGLERAVRVMNEISRDPRKIDAYRASMDQ